MRHTHRYAAMVTVAVTSIALVGCSTAGAPPQTDGPATITMIGADPATAFAPLIKEFEKQNPDITVEYQNVPFDQYNNVIQQRVGGKDASVDVYLADSGAVGSLAEKGFLTDLSEFKDQVDKVALPTAIEGNVYQDKLWALPMWTSLQYLYYNKDILDAAGVEYPSIDPANRETWEQIVTDGAKAQASGAEYGLLFDQTDRYYQLQALVESAGGGSGASGDNLLTADVTNPGWVKAMNWYGALFADGVSPRGIETDQMNVLFSSGKSAFFIGGPWSLEPIGKGAPKINYGIAPNPMFAGGTPAMPTGSWNIAISPATDSLAAARKFVEFASLDAKGNALSAQEVIIPPTNIESFDAYITKIDAKDAPATTGMGALTLSELKDAAVNRPNSPGFTQLQDVLGRAFSDIRNGKPVDSTLQSAQDELQSLWDRL